MPANETKRSHFTIREMASLRDVWYGNFTPTGNRLFEIFLHFVAKYTLHKPKQFVFFSTFAL
jgi:hypothetical protein